MPDALEPRELSTLTAIELGQILDAIDLATASIARVAAESERLLGHLESQLIHKPEDRELKAAAREIRGRLRGAQIELRALSKRQSRVQTILRTLQSI